jgi:hypothetical protein
VTALTRLKTGLNAVFAVQVLAAISVLQFDSCKILRIRLTQPSNSDRSFLGECAELKRGSPAAAFSFFDATQKIGNASICLS